MFAVFLELRRVRHTYSTTLRRLIRFEQLNFESLELRWLREDLELVYKILFGAIRTKNDCFFTPGNQPQSWPQLHFNYTRKSDNCDALQLNGHLRLCDALVRNHLTYLLTYLPDVEPVVLCFNAMSTIHQSRFVNFQHSFKGRKSQKSGLEFLPQLPLGRPRFETNQRI